MIRERKKETKTDTVLLILVLLLAVFGLVMLFSISEYNGRVRFGDSAYYFKKQLFATALGLMTMYIVAETDYRFFVRLAPAAYLLSMGLSTAVLFVGQEINGSRRWLNFGPLSFRIRKSSSDPFSHLADPGKQKDYSWLLVYVQDNADTSSNCRTGRLQ